MKLQLRKIPISSIVFGDETTISQDTLILNKEEIVERLKEIPNVKDIKIDIALPGEKTRIIPVKDVIEPRYTVEGTRGFAGVTSDVAQHGSGIVNVLEGAAIVTIGDIVGFQEGIIDMWGEGAKWTPFSKTCNVVVDISVNDDITPHEHEETCRLVGLKASEIVGEASKEADFKEVDIYQIEDNVTETKNYPNLPKVVYVEMLISQGLLHASYIYGVDSAHILPTLINPLEELDGAVISGNCVAACDKITTYQHQNNEIIKNLYKLHGKEINFLGVVLVPEMTTLNGKFISCDYTAKLCAMLGADGVIVSEEGYGNPDSDLVMICSRLEKQGIKTVLVTDECSGWDGAYDEKTGTLKCELNAIISATSEIGAHNATVELY